MSNRESVIYYTGTNLDIIYYNNVTTSYPVHTHSQHYTVGIVIDGKIEIQIKSEKYIYITEDIFIIPPDIPHSIKTFNDCPYTMLSVCIHEKYLASCNIDNIKSAIERKLNEIFNEKECAVKFSVMLSNAIRHIAKADKSKYKDSYSMDIKDKIMEEPELSVSIENMSCEAYVSSFHLIRQFKKEIGITPHQFQLQCRIRKAQRLLSDDKTITEVAFATGFCDQSHFIRCFKKIVKMTPVSYIRAVKVSKVQE